MNVWPSATSVRRVRVVRYYRTVENCTSRYHPVVQWQGRTLTAVTPFDSGARRVVVNFDESFRSCTVDVVYGKERGVPGVVLHADTTRLVLAQIKISSPECKVIDGNMFGGNGE
jgi:hypothetical protein